MTLAGPPARAAFCHAHAKDRRPPEGRDAKMAAHLPHEPEAPGQADEKNELTQAMRDYLQSAYRLTVSGTPITITALS